ncbi:hypothetical protein AO382_1160 [Moraxella catarrhalis]|uniref:Uncharacterized protein n=1 Tax=Moraxella catarrhalis TaxID=480 RepID=A0A7Z0UZ21_MORCA|nr:hypothetical protein AO382_1160 [Moraxella catarrhalis]
MMVLIDNYCYNITDKVKVNQRSNLSIYGLNQSFAVVGLVDTHNGYH